MNTPETEDPYEKLEDLTKAIHHLSAQYVELCHMRPNKVDRYTEDFREVVLPMLTEHGSLAAKLDAEEAGGDQMVGKATKDVPRPSPARRKGIPAVRATPISPYSPFPTP